MRQTQSFKKKNKKTTFVISSCNRLLTPRLILYDTRDHSESYFSTEERRDKRTKTCTTASNVLRFFSLIFNCGIFNLPYVCDGLFIFIVCSPYSHLITFGSNINDSSTNIVTVVVKSFSNKTQELQENMNF